MGRASRIESQNGRCEIIDFDAALLEACPPALRADLMMEAQLLADAFAPSGTAAALQKMAAQLSAGERDAEMGRAHARRLAAALKHLAETPDPRS